MSELKSRFGTNTQQAYDRVIRKLDRLEYIVSATAATIWGFIGGFGLYILVDILIN